MDPIKFNLSGTCKIKYLPSHLTRHTADSPYHLATPETSNSFLGKGDKTSSRVPHNPPT